MEEEGEVIVAMANYWVSVVGDWNGYFEDPIYQRIVICYVIGLFIKEWYLFYVLILVTMALEKPCTTLFMTGYFASYWYFELIASF